MTSTQRAIEDAVKGGFKNEGNLTPEAIKDIAETMLEVGYLEGYLLDPKFWQALMIGRGHDVKEGTMRCSRYNPRADEPGETGCNADKCEYAGYIDWKYTWHRFIDARAEGKSIEEAFKTLEN